jgi:hypothetical protein
MVDNNLKGTGMCSEFYVADPRKFLEHITIQDIVDRLHKKNLIVDDIQTLVSLDETKDMSEKNITLSVAFDYERHGLLVPHHIMGYDLRCFDKDYFLRIQIQNHGVKNWGKYQGLSQINALFRCDQFHNAVDVLSLQDNAISAVHKVYDNMLDHDDLAARRKKGD